MGEKATPKDHWWRGGLQGPAFGRLQGVGLIDSALRVVGCYYLHGDLATARSPITLWVHAYQILVTGLARLIAVRADS